MNIIVAMNLTHTTASYPSYTPIEQQPTSPQKSEGFFGWLPGSGLVHKVIEKTKVRDSENCFMNGLFNKTLSNISVILSRFWMLFHRHTDSRTSSFTISISPINQVPSQPQSTKSSILVTQTRSHWSISVKQLPIVVVHICSLWSFNSYVPTLCSSCEAL